MGMSRLMGLFAVIPASVLLTISFFVLFAIRKVESQGLKAFGYVVSAFLWIAVSLILSAGLFTLSTGRCPMMKMMGKMQGNMCGQMQGMQMQMPMMQHNK
ncbi:MAG: hypothetical protein PHO70_06265 [Candidatus Omnitrophica bacterium]|nr:hypothetical protein [Candidatus Omnitrophota bacterium]